METRRINKCSTNAKARLVKPRKKITKDAKSNKSYGPNCGRPDLPEKAFQVAKSIELARLETDKANIDEITRRTYGQRFNTSWFTVRKKVVDASFFSRIVNAKSPKSYKSLLYEMLYSPNEFSKNAEMRHQRLYVEDAVNCFRTIYKEHVLDKTGIHIDRELGFLGASPLRLNGSDSLLIVKCPVKGFKKTIDEAINSNLFPFWKKKENCVSVNLKSSWHIEMQEMLRVAK